MTTMNDERRTSKMDNMLDPLLRRPGFDLRLIKVNMLLRLIIIALNVVCSRLVLCGHCALQEYKF